MKKRQLLPLLAALGLLACHADTADTASAAAAPAATAPEATPPAVPPRPTGLSYPWQTQSGPAAQTLAARFPAPTGSQRIAAAAGSWSEWLRWLPLKPVGTKALLYNGEPKNRQDVVAAVVDIDVPPQDLQQCADAVMRLRAEYLFSHDPQKVRFNLTTGYDFKFSDYVAGTTFKVRGNEVTPAAKAVEAPTHAALARYLVPTFGYAGTLSLSKELQLVPLHRVQPGDVFIHGGSPGHAVLVVDVAENPTSKQQYVLLVQSYMPAQNIHVLRNGGSPELGAWFAVPASDDEGFNTPEWAFERQELKRFVGTRHGASGR